MSKLLEALASNKWAMEPRYLQQVAQYLMLRAVGREAQMLLDGTTYERSACSKQANQGANNGPGYALRSDAAVIPIGGSLYRYSSQINTMSGARGTSYEAISKAIDGAVKDPQARSIMLLCDSPGGTVSGVEMTALKIAAANKVKPVHAHIAGMGASAMFWLASQARTLTATADSEVGSIGVYTVVYDTTAWYEKNGYKAHLVKDGTLKGVGVDGVPVTEQDLKVVQEEVSGYGDLFRAAVARGRPQLAGSIAEIADGRVHIASKAKALGLIDGVVNSLEDAIALSSRATSAKVGAASSRRVVMVVKK